MPKILFGIVGQLTKWLQFIAGRDLKDEVILLSDFRQIWTVTHLSTLARYLA